MRTLAQLLADLFSLLFALPGALSRWLSSPPAPDPYDDAAELIRAAEHKLVEDDVAPAEPVASIVRRFLAGDETSPIFMLPRRQQAYVIGLERSGVDVADLTDTELEAHVTGRAAASGWRPLYYPGDRPAQEAGPPWDPAPARAFAR